MLNSKPVTIYVGAFGSGKTEVSINKAVEYASLVGKAYLVDLDVIKPYFKSREKRLQLAQLGVEVVAPPVMTIDLPIITPQVQGLLQGPQDKYIVIDLGGDEDGARVIGGFAPQLMKNNNFDYLMVINTFRPFSQTPSEIIALIKELQTVSRLPVNGLVSNSHLQEKTTIEDIISGYEIVKEVSRELNLPIYYVCVEEKLKKQVEREVEVPVFPLKIYIDFMDFSIFKKGI